MQALHKAAVHLLQHVQLTYPTWLIALQIVAGVAALIIGFGFYLPARWQYWHIPGPRPEWYKGNLEQLGVPHSFHETLTAWYKRYGKIYKLFLGATPVVVISDPELVKQVCIKQFKNFHDRPRNAIQYSHGEQEEFWEGGIIVLRGKYWAGIRAACEPLFHSKMLRKYASIMNDAATMLVSKVAQQQSGMQINTHLAAMTMDVIGQTAFGVGFDAQDDNKSEIVTQCQVVFEPAGDKVNRSRPAGVRRKKRRFGVSMHKLMLLFPSLMGFLYRLSCALRVPKVLRLTTARGYIVGTSQVLLQNARASKEQCNDSCTNSSSDILDTGSSLSSVDAAAASNSFKNQNVSTAQNTPNPDGMLSPRSSSGSSTDDSPRHITAFSSSGQTKTGTPVDDTSKQSSDPSKEAVLPAEPLKPAAHESRVDAWAFAAVDRLYQQAKARGMHMYRDQVPEDYSLFHHLMNSVNKETGQPLSNMQICAQAFTMLLAGYETTSTALSYTLYALARNPEVYRKLLEEVDTFGRDKVPSFDDLSQFKWIEACFLEAMRMYPIITPLWALAREAKESVNLAGYHIPKGTRVWLNVRGLHYDEANFPNPQAFRPERFLEGSPDGPSTRHPYAYMAFGAGPHKCLGYRFAMEEGILTLVRLHQKFAFSLNEARHPPGSELSFLSAITYMPKGGIWLDAHPRQPVSQ